MSSPWDIKTEQDQGESKPRFGQLEIEFENKTSKNDIEYIAYTVHVFPIGKGSDPLYKGNQWNKSWTRVTVPSMHNLVEKGKVDSIQDLATSNHWISFKWSEYQSQDSYDIRKNKTDYPERNKRDDNGIIYASFIGIEFLDVFANEDACLVAHDKYYGINNDAVKETIPGFIDDKPVLAVDETTAIAFVDGLKNSIKPILKKAIGGNNKVNLDAAKEFLANELPMMANLPLEHESVQTLIKEVENDPPF